MKSRWILLGVTAAVVASAGTVARPARAEYPAPAPYLGVFGGGNLVLRNWDLGDRHVESQRPKDLNGMLGLRLGFQIFRPLAIEAEFGYLPIKSTMGGSNKAYSYSVNAYYQLLSRDWTPYVGAGIGAFQSASGDLGKDWDQRTHVGLGLRGLITPWMALRTEARGVVTDGYGSGGSYLLEAHAGLDFFLSTAEKAPMDRDKDGIVDSQDQCPDEAGPRETDGCPDRDKDGIIDKKDQCPEVAGVPQFGGCPDSDGDGIPDAQDNCPKVAGPKETQGCPVSDRDKDGVPDAEDKCPDLAGAKETLGCPDSDADGIPDPEDKCPKLAGPKETQGCPDRDKDGIIDPDDKCPDTPGLRENQGCMPEAAKKFTGAIQGIYFDTGSAVIKAQSNKVLDEAVVVLKKYPSMRLRVEGHTDNVGAPAMNQKLSEERAAAVRAYLVSHGIEGDRIESAGFGDTKPAKPNDTPAGRSANRRIEFVPITSK